MFLSTHLSIKNFSKGIFFPDIYRKKQNNETTD